MNKQTLDLLEACRLDMEPTGIETSEYLSACKNHDKWMAIDLVTREEGLNESQMKFCFWLKEDMKRIEKSLFRNKKPGSWTLRPVHNEWGDKINYAGQDNFYDEDFNYEMSETSSDDAHLEPIDYVQEIVRRAGHRADTWMELALRRADEILRAQHANTKDAIRMRQRRAAGKVKSRPPRPKRTLEQDVDKWRKCVDTRIANMAAYEEHVKVHGVVSVFDYKSKTSKANKSLRSAKKALATAESKLNAAKVTQ